jgi:phosphoglycerate kinase
MNCNKKTVMDLEVEGRKALLRCDFNVPLDKTTQAIKDDKRIEASLPTIRYLLQRRAAVILCSHLGRPKGRWNEAYSMKPVGVRLSELLGMPVQMAEDVVGEDARSKAAALQPGQVLLLENLRFHKEEEENDPEFSRQLASMADVFVSDAFGTAHRAHASTCGVAAFLPAVSGLLLEKELRIMGRALEDPRRPFVAMLGGAKISDKLGVIQNLLNKADMLIIGGGMAYTFIKAMGGSVGKSLVEEDKLPYAMEMMDKAKRMGKTILLPVDNLAAAEFSPDAEPVKVEAGAIADDLMGMDIGEKTIALFCDALKKAGTILWNGPMGVFEFPAFAAGTKAVAKAMAESNAVTIVGGGDSASAVDQFGYADRMTHVSTGGGSSLEFFEGRELPGVACLMDQE